MIKYDVKSVVCDYGVFENGELKIIVNSQANAFLIKYILEQDLQHRVVVSDLLEKKNKKTRRFRAMTVSEFCATRKGIDCDKCPSLRRPICRITPYKTNDGKYILVEVINDARNNLQNI